MTSDCLPTDVLLTRLHCEYQELSAIVQTLANSAQCLQLGAKVSRSAWSKCSAIAYIYLQLPHRMALPQSALDRMVGCISSAARANVARLALMLDIPGASRGHSAAVHYAVEMTPEAAWEIELQRWYDTEHLPGLALVPGCVRAQRYWNYDDGPRSLACYDLVDEDVVGCEAWLAVRNTAWSSRMRPRFTETIRSTFSLHSSVGMDK